MLTLSKGLSLLISTWIHQIYQSFRLSKFLVLLETFKLFPNPLYKFYWIVTFVGIINSKTFGMVKCKVLACQVKGYSCVVRPLCLQIYQSEIISNKHLHKESCHMRLVKRHAKTMWYFYFCNTKTILIWKCVTCYSLILDWAILVVPCPIHRYSIVGKFGRGEVWWIWWITRRLPKHSKSW